MAETIIPKQHYVTIQYRTDSSTESGLLGFASPYTKDAAFIKRKQTQDSWAYGHGAEFTIHEDDMVTGRFSENSKFDAVVLFGAKCYPIIIDNDLVEGFEIAKSVKRNGSWGPGNVVWRIADPRGFELEISSANFARILDCTTIINGTIQGKCLWGRNGKDNILLPEASDVYQAAAKHTVKINKKVSLIDVSVGDIVEILSTKIAKEDQICQYLGKYFFLEVEEGVTKNSAHSSRISGIYYFNTKQVDRYLFQSIEDNTYFALASPKIIDIVTPIKTPLDKNIIAKEVTEQLSQDVTVSNTNHLILLSSTKIDLSTITTQLVPLDETITDSWPLINNYSFDHIVGLYDGLYWLPTRNHRSKNPLFKEIDISELNKNKLICKSTTMPSNYYSGNQYNLRYIVRDDIKIEDLQKFRLTVTANKITGKIYQLGYI